MCSSDLHVHVGCGYWNRNSTYSYFMNHCTARKKGYFYFLLRLVPTLEKCFASPNLVSLALDSVKRIYLLCQACQNHHIAFVSSGRLQFRAHALSQRRAAGNKCFFSRKSTANSIPDTFCSNFLLSRARHAFKFQHAQARVKSSFRIITSEMDHCSRSSSRR